ncbi:zinc finger [Paramuricea clavata]|uniref:TPA: zinc finger n=1 Tax=Paramuricea clavata TaxID=317549 RepID=A0A6S7K871_PARCT|nr:zinc finger [Paramuricea clavata]
MDVAHSSIMGGHLGIQKTTDKVTSNFYWPGIHGDVTRFCRSCDICQKTIQKGKFPKVPLEMIPLIDTPFKRIAVDLVGSIYPPSEQGHVHRYILTLVDYTTRYPDAVPLKSISTEAVAESLVDMYSRLGVPEEVLSDLGTQFVSECMQEVSRLLSIKQLSTMPYHPMCNGLIEKFNGSLNNMLKKLCSEQPKQWPRYINALLFAYRKVPQGSTGFSPFELLYGRTVRGIRRETTTEVKEREEASPKKNDREIEGSSVLHVAAAAVIEQRESGR